MLNNREKELQAIIKTLESKVQSLRSELNNVLQNQQARLSEALKTERSIIQEKDKAIQFLMSSIKKLKEDKGQYQSLKMTQLVDDYNISEISNQQLRTSNSYLQKQLIQQREHYQKMIASKESELKEVKLSCQTLQKQRKRWVQQAQKLNRFYADAVRRQPEREETLLWVDKLIQFMTKASEIVVAQKKERNETIENIKRNLKDEFYQINTLISKNQAQLSAEKNNFLKQLQRVLQGAEADCKLISKSNEQFWQNLNKVKIKEEKESLSKLQQQFENYRVEKQKQVQDLCDAVDSCEKEKKTLVVSIQEMKSYYQLRQKALKQETDMLKQTISDLIESQQVREKQFEKEIQRLGDQIQHLTVRFYEKIQLPINAVYTKIKQEVQKFKNHFSGFFSGNNFQKSINQFHAKIVQYLIHLNQHKNLRELMKDSVQECLKITQFLKPFEKGHQKGYENVDNSIIGNYSSLIYQSGVSVQTNRQKQSKLNYELATMKKQLQKLKQYVKQLEKKSGSKVSNLANSKYIQLMAQNEVYKQRIQKFQRNEREGFSYNNQIMEQSRIGRINTAILERLVQKCEHILQYAAKEEQYIIELSSCISSLNLIIINPLQTFENLVKQIKNISSLTAVLPLETKTSERFESFDLQRKKQLFKEITMKKNEAIVNIQKSNLQLTKTLREYLSKNSSRNVKEAENKQPEKFKSYQSRQMLQKRLKQAHSQRLKNRQEFLVNLRQLQEKVKNIQSRYSKKQNINFIKFEESIIKSIEEMSKIAEPKQKFKEIKAILDEALLDTKSKLQNCKIENEGLIREIEMLKMTKAVDTPSKIVR